MQNRPLSWNDLQENLENGNLEYYMHMNVTCKYMYLIAVARVLTFVCVVIWVIRIPGSFQSQFPDVDDSEIKQMDASIATLTTKAQGLQDNVRCLESGEL